MSNNGESILNGLSSNSVSQGFCQPDNLNNVFKNPVIANNDINNSMNLKHNLNEEQKLQNKPI